MKLPSIIAPTLLAITCFTFTGGAVAATTSTKPVLEKGMAGDTIIQLYGKPNVVQPMKNPEAKTEKWIYRRKTEDTTTQDASYINMVPAFIGISGTGQPMVADTPRLDFKLKHIRIYQVTALLMVDGKLVLGKQWTEREERFDN